VRAYAAQAVRLFKSSGTGLFYHFLRKFPVIAEYVHTIHKVLATRRNKKADRARPGQLPSQDADLMNVTIKDLTPVVPPSGGGNNLNPPEGGTTSSMCIPDADCHIHQITAYGLRTTAYGLRFTASHAGSPDVAALRG
jgi:hypothetical protein